MTPLHKSYLVAQENEITEHVIYSRLAMLVPQKNNRKVLSEIAADELRHYEFWKTITKTTVKPNMLRVRFFLLIARICGLTFAVKLLESQEDSAQETYGALKGSVPDIQLIIDDEGKHEHQLLALIDEERLKYVSSIVLGLNDALVELTGALAGLTLALQNTRLVAIVGLITGIAASMSMAASEYLSTKQEDTTKNPVKASIYTGIAYVMTVLFLILPYLIVDNIFAALFFVMANACLIIFIFTYYVSVAKGLSMKHRFLEMAGLSFTIAGINFFVGWVIRAVFKIEI